MKELRHAELSEQQLGYLQRHATEEAKLVTATSLFVISEAGEPVGYRLATMFNLGVPVKWEQARSIVSHQALPPARPRRAPAPVMRASELVSAAVNNGTRMVKRTLLFPSPLNPRKNFEAEYLGQLADSIVAQGMLNDLIVRPRKGGAPGELEIAAGECRWRASELAQLEELPVKVRDLSDAEMLSLMLVENMKRKDLTTIEECDAFNLALAQQNPDGSPVYATVEAFAKQIGERGDYVKDRLRLKKLPASGRTALQCGDISYKTAARVICSLPEALVPKLLDVVLHPGKYNVWTDGEKRCLTAEEAEEYKRAHIARELRDTPFDLDDAKLLPAELNAANQRVRGGACEDCPWNSATLPTEDGAAAKPGRVGRPRGESKWCHNPECFAKKVEIHTAAALVNAKEKGYVILSDDEAKKLLYDDGELREGSGYIRLDRKPDEAERNEKLEAKSLPLWGEIVRGTASADVVTDHTREGDAVHSVVEAELEVPVSVVVTKRGHLVPIVEKTVAVTAAQKLGTAHYLNLSSGGGTSLVNSELADRERKERAEQKLRNEVSFAAMGEVVRVIENAPVIPEELYGWLLEMAIWHGGNDAVQFVLKRRGIPAGDNAAKALTDAAKEIASFGERLSIALETLAARPLKFSGVGEPFFKRLAALYQVDVAAIEKGIRAKAKAEKPKKAKAKKTAEVEA